MKKLVDLTPLAHKKCDFEMSCPAVFKSDVGTYVIIGKTVNPNTEPDLRGRVGSDETAVEIAFDLLEGAIKTSIVGKKQST
jgi:hypothetical protein